jgi:hypothetical protein
MAEGTTCIGINDPMSNFCLRVHFGRQPVKRGPREVVALAPSLFPLALMGFSEACAQKK